MDNNQLGHEFQQNNFRPLLHVYSRTVCVYVLNVIIDIQTSKELIQMDTGKMMTYGTFTMDDEKLTQS